MEQPIIPPVDKELLLSELTPDKCLRTTNKSHNQIFIVDIHDSPNVVREIGRQREEVEAFLRQNPDIEQEYRQYYSCEPIVTPHHAHYRYKDNLKRKAVQPTAWRWWTAAACEG